MDDEPPYQISIAVTRVDAGSVPTHDLRNAILAALRMHGAAAAELSIVLTDDEQIAELNREFLDVDGPTDVIAFDMSDEPGAERISGEVVVSLETAAREARARGHTLAAEVALYALHGVLHLLGYNDAEEDQAARMHAAEDRILSEVGVGCVFAAGPTTDADSAGRGGERPPTERDLLKERPWKT